MATQKNAKSKKPAPPKAKPTKSAGAKKIAAKPAVKAKAANKPSSAVKAKPKAKPAPAKAKKPIAAVKKSSPVKAKATTKPKAAVKAPAKTTKSKTVVKAKPVVKTAVKPVVKAKAPAKPVDKAKVTKVAKPTAKPAPKPVAKSAAKVHAKPSPLAGKAPKALAAPKSGASSAKPAMPKSTPVVTTKVAANKTTTKKVVTTPAANVPAKPAPKPIQPVAKKSAIKEVKKKPLPVYQPKPAAPASVGAPKLVKESPSEKLVVASTTKHAEKMSENKDKKPVTTTTLPEEPQKTRYSDSELEEFDQLIDEKLIIAREQLEFYLKQLEDMAENPDNKIKGLDDGLSSLESERVSSMASRQQKLIHHLENAKIRIKNKVYGICRETGKLISKERLRAVPHATLSIEAKQAQN